MRKIGLYFGSFNPITKAHEDIADYVLKQCHLDEVHFVISPQNPHKQYQTMVDINTRIDMIEAVCEEHNNLFINTIELTLPIPSYTADTLKAIEHSFEPNVEYYIIMGYDVFITLHTWYNFKDILKYNIILLPRGDNNDSYEDYKKTLESYCNHPLNITFLQDMHLMNISSTHIREQIKMGIYDENIVNKQVLEIIKNKKLYLNGEN